jgi:hypothetical protein
MELLERRNLLTAAPTVELSIPPLLPAAAGSQVTVPVNLTDGNDSLQLNSTALTSVGLLIKFDPNVLTINPTTPVIEGKLLTDSGEAWNLASVPNQNAGSILISVFTTDGLTLNFNDALVDLDFTVNAGAPVGPTAINLALTDANNVTKTVVNDVAGETLTLSPAPTNASNDAVDGSLTIAAIGNVALQRLTAIEGQSFSSEVASFSDAAASTTDFEATIDWGDNHTSAGTVTTADGGGFLVNGSHTYAEEGADPVTVTITDTKTSQTASATGTATVSDATITGVTTASAGGGVEVVTPATLGGATFTDANVGAASTDFTVTSVDWGDTGSSTAGLSVSGGNGNYTVTGSHLYAEEGPHPFSITVKDQVGGNLATITGAANVADATLTGITTSSAVGGVESAAPATLSGATFTDANTSATSSGFAVTSIDWGDGGTSAAGLSVSGSGGNYTVTGSHLYTLEGNHSFSITVKDVGGGNTATITGSANVASALTGSTAASATGGVESVTPATLAGATFTVINTGAASTDFTVTTVDWGDGGSSTTGLSASGSGGNYTVTGSHLYTEEGPHPFTITVNDPGGSAATINGTANVADAPLNGVTTASAVGGVESATAATLSGATFTDANRGAASSDFTVTAVDWGDGGTSAAGLSVSGSGGNYTVTGSHLYSLEGNHRFSITVKDVGGGNTAAITGSANVASALTGSTAASAAGGVESVTPATIAGATFTDINTGAAATDFTVTSVDWGNNSSSTAGLTVSGGAGNYTVTGSHLYAEEGPHPFTITVKDAGGSNATITGIANVADAPLTGVTTASATGGVVSATPATLSGATFTDANTGAASTDFTVTAVDWGDGGTSAAGLSVSGSGGNYTVTGLHLYSLEGNHRFSITVKDVGGGNTAAIIGSANVASALTGSIAASATGGVESVTPATLAGATFTDIDTGAASTDFTVASVDWGDKSSSTAGLSVSGAGGNYTVTGSHPYAEEGPHPFTITVKDPGGSTATINGAANVADAPLNATGQTFAPTEGVTFTGDVASFTDANTAAQSSDFTAKIVWGDGTTTTGVIVAAPSAAGAFLVTGSHLFTTAGSEPATVTMEDNGGSKATASATANVANEPASLVLAEDIYVIGSGTIAVTAANGVLANDSGTGALIVTSTSVTGADGGTFVFTPDGAFTYTRPAQFPGFDYAQYVASDAAGEHGSATVNVLSQSGGVVWKFYESVLNRDPDYGGLDNWVTELSNGGMTGDIAVGFFESDELLNKVITGYYEQYLLRAPDPDGLAHWKAVWRANGGPETIKAFFAESDEFYASAGGTPDAWINALYQRILDRTPDPDGEKFWLNYYQQQVAAGTPQPSVRYNIAMFFLTSKEDFGDDVTGWFDEYLQRAPGDSELQHYVNEMVAGASDRQIEQEITDLPEYGQYPPAAPDGTGVWLPDYHPKAAANQQATITAKDALFAQWGGLDP